jgi:streptogramin lyase
VKRILAIALAALLLAGCTKVATVGSGDGTPDPNGARHPYTIPHVLRYATAEDIVGLNPHLWFTESNAGKIGRVTPSGTITEFATSSSSSYANIITTGPDGNLWFTEYGVGKIGKINP